MTFEINLPSNGMIPNYPKKVYMGYTKVKHWRDLYLAGEQGEEALEDVLTSVLDDVIDFNRTEYIKSSNDLTLPDRKKLFYWQRINCKGNTFQILFKCSKCGESVDNTFDLLKIKENKIKKMIEEKVVNIKNDISLILKVPRKSDLSKLERNIFEYKNNVFENINKLIKFSEIQNLEKELKNIKVNTNKFVLAKLKEKSNNPELKIDVDENIENLKNDNTKKRIDIENKILELKEEAKSNITKVNEILKRKNLLKKDIVESIDDLDFDPYTEYLFSICIGIENAPENFIDFILNIEAHYMFKEIEDYMVKASHGFEEELTFKCPNCRHRFKSDMVLDPSFFLK